MKGNLKKVLSLALLAFLLAGAVDLPLPGPIPAAARAEDGFTIDEHGVLTRYDGPDGVVRIPHGVTAIGKEVFKGRNKITGVVIPNTVRVIGMKAFWGCTGLEQVVIPKGVTEIGDRAFRDCTGLAVIATPNTVRVIGEGAFWGCESLTAVSIPNKIKVIGQGTFMNCASLKKVTIPKGVTTIGKGAFAGCHSLTSVTIPNKVDVIEEWTFMECVSLKKVTIPKGVTTIGDGAFMYCVSLTDVTIPKAVDMIGEEAFFNCTSLKKVTLPRDVTEIGDGTFLGCSGLTSVTIPKGVTEIGRRAFLGCTGLANIAIPSSVTTIGHEAFAHCTGLTSVVIPDSVTDIAEDAFDGCPNLRFVTLPSEPQAPGFAGSNPKTIVIPDNLIPPMIVLRERQSMVLPRFSGAKVAWIVADPTVAAVVKNRTVRGLRGEDTTLTLKVKQAAQGKALTLNGQPLKPDEEYDIVLKVVGKGEATVRKVAINGPGKLALHPLGLEHGYPATAALDLVFTPAALPGFWKENCFYISGNPGVAQVAMDEETGEGKIFAIKPGKAVITAYTPNMKTAKVTVTVKGWVTSLKLKDGDGNDVNKLPLSKRDIYQLTPEFNEDAVLKAVRWTSSKPGVAYVDGNDQVYALSTGTARITATSLDGSNKKATVIVTVTEAD